MELYFLDGNFDLVKGPVDVFTSAVFSERYYEVGSFVLHLPRELWRDLSAAVYVRTGYSGGKCLCGRILYMRSEISGDCEVGGELLEGMLGDRLVLGKGGISAEGNLGVAVLDKVEENLRSLGVVIDRSGSAVVPVSGGVSLTWNYDKLSDWLYSVLKPWGASFEVVLDFETNKPVFRLVKGADRSSDGGAVAAVNSVDSAGSGGVSVLADGSSGAERAVFSTSYGNIFSLNVEKNSAKMKNFAYIEGSDGTVVEVGGAGVDSAVGNAGGRRVEIYRKASDIRPADFAETTGYTAALEQRGEELLAKYPASVYISAESDSQLVPKYGRDYFLGDVCDVCDGEIGLSCGMRLTGVDTVCEDGGVRVLPYFGETVSLADVIRETIG